MALSEATINDIGTIRAIDLNRYALATPRLKQFLNEAEYDIATGQYTRNGQPVPPTEIALLIEAEQQALTRRFETATEAYLAGDITLEEWERRLADDSKTGFVIIALLIFGGLALLARNPRGSAIWGTTGAALREHIGGIAGYGQRLAEGLRSPAQLRGYVKYKARGIRPIAAQLKKDSAIALGFNEGRRFLDPTARHCVQCPGYERTDWVPIDEIVPLGVGCDCRGRCRCSIQYRRNLNVLGIIGEP
jgi:hypothetical protein